MNLSDLMLATFKSIETITHYNVFTKQYSHVTKEH